MKFNKLLLVSILLLAILTIGAVSASDSINATEVSSEEPAEPPIAADISDDSSDDDEQITDGVALASSDENPANELSAGNKKNVSYDVEYNEYYINNYSSHSLNPITMYWYDSDAPGILDISWGKNGGFSLPVRMAINTDYTVGPVGSLSFDQIFNEIEGPLEYGVSETVKISYIPNETDNYNPFTISHKFVIDYTGDISIDNYDYGATPNLYVYVPNYGGDATIYVNGKKFKDIYLDFDESYTCPLQKLNYGDNTISVKLVNGAQISRVFILKVNPEMNISVAYGNTGVEVTLPVNATGDVIVDVEGDIYYGVVENGKAVVKIDDLEPGDYYVEVAYSGDDFYAQKEDSTFLHVEKIIKKATSITVSMINGLEITSILKDENGDAVANMEIVCDIGGEKVTSKTNDKGEFTVKAKNNALLNMTFEGDPLYNSSSAVIMLKNLAPVQKATIVDVPSTMTKTAVDYKAGEKGTMFYFYLKDSDGKALPNKAIKIGIFDKIYTVKTDANGRGGLQINIANANYYTYAITFLGDDDYKASFSVCSLEIVKKQITITPAKTSYSFKASAKTKTITATLKSSNSYIPKGKQVTLAIAGKTFKATIGDKGQISLNIGSITKKGTYKVAIKFAGTNTYAAATSKTITVKIS